MKPEYYFVFDVESIGLHGEGFAVAGGIYLANGSVQYEFDFACPAAEADGSDSDREWVAANVPVLDVTHRDPYGVRAAFWGQWNAAKVKYPGIVMAVECGWPVEANFLSACVADTVDDRNWEGPYPLHEIASFMASAGMNPMDSYPRNPSELPAHNPLADSRQSARLLAEALKGATK